MLQLQFITKLIEKMSQETGSNLDTYNEEGVDKRVISYCDTNSYISEQYKSIVTKLLGHGEAPAIKSLVIASSQSGEGKTTTVCNLASTLALNFDKKVIIVDGDLRRPGVHKYFSLESKPGLSDALESGENYRKFTFKTQIENLFVMPAGKTTKAPTTLLHSENMAELHKTLTEDYDIVIYDTSPVLNTADAQALGTFADAVLFVVQADKTPKHMIDEALATLKDTDAEPDACILTNSTKKLDYYSYWTNYRYRQYYNEQYYY